MRAIRWKEAQLIKANNMLDLEFIRNNPDKVKENSKNKNINVDIEKLLSLDKEYRKVLQDTETLRAKRNEISQVLSRDLDTSEREKNLKEAESLKVTLRKSESAMKEIKDQLDQILLSVPNMSFEGVPIGKDESKNVVLREEGSKPDFKFKPKDYLEIARVSDWIDIERAAKVSGTRFGYIKGDLALLEFAIIRFAMDFLTKEGFIPVLPPVLVKPKYMKAMGFLHGEAEDDVYYLEKDDLYLVGTSEQALGPMHADETFRSGDLPKRYVGFSTCFRRESGSYGRDTKGILRVHQFDKIEMVVFAHPDKSREEHKYLLSLNEKMMKDLNLPYRVVHISTGDMGLTKAEQFDIETWMPSENTYRETHSASNTTDFQSRRLNIKFEEGGDKKYVHMLNDTVFALGRTLIAIIENYQDEDGGVRIPKVLQKYMGTDIIKSSS